MTTNHFNTGLLRCSFSTNVTGSATLLFLGLSMYARVHFLRIHCTIVIPKPLCSRYCVHTCHELCMCIPVWVWSMYTRLYICMYRHIQIYVHCCCFYFQYYQIFSPSFISLVILTSRHRYPSSDSRLEAKK